MAPVCSRYMESFPHPNPNGNQMQFQPWPPMWGNPMPPRMNVEQSESHQAYGPWNYGSSNFGFPGPWECHGCCQHGHPPHNYYGFRPSYNHFPQPQPPMFCYHGPYPPYQEAHPPYNTPVSHYAAEQPWYEYDKNAMGSMCAKCLSKCDSRDGSGVRIEEHEPEQGPKENNALAPMKFGMNGHYPVVWIPSEYLKNKDNVKDAGESKQGEMEPRLWNGRWPLSVKNDGDGNERPCKKDPKEWNGWFPLDLNSMKSLMEDGARRAGNQDRRTDLKEELPFPFFRVSDSDVQEDGGKKSMEVCNGSKPSEQQPAMFKVVPVRQPDNKETMEVSASPKPIEQQPVVFKLIPVKQLENKDSEGEKNVERSIHSSKENEVKEIPVKENKAQASQLLEITAKKPTDNKEKRKFPSPPRGSKLPPICLRVDPLPKKRSGSGASRSPSPPSHNRNMQESSNKSPKISNTQAEKNKPQLGSKAQEALKEQQKEVRGRKEFEVAEARGSQASEVEAKSQAHHGTGVPQDTFEKQDTGRDETFVGMVSEGGNANVRDDDKPEQDKKEKKSLSEPDAATIIQSAYRGYEVRKWEPMKKLKQIGKVKEQASELRGRIQALESSTGDEKERVVMGEMIMNLLLQLDTIQGLHPSVREVRKSVARELVLLQEKLDSMASKNVEKKKLHGLCETATEEVNEVPCKNVIKSTILVEESGESESKNQLETFSATDDDEHTERNERLANTFIKSPPTDGEVMRSEVDNEDQAAASMELKNEDGDANCAVENHEEEVGVSQEDPADYTSMLEQVADYEIKELTGLSGEADAELIESRPRADDKQQAPVLSLDDDKVEESRVKPDANQDVDELTEGKQEVAVNMEASFGDEPVKMRNMSEELEAKLQEPSFVKSSLEEMGGSVIKEDEFVMGLLAKLPQAVDEIEAPLDNDVEETVTSEEQGGEDSSGNIELQASKKEASTESSQEETNEKLNDEAVNKGHLMEAPVEPNDMSNVSPVNISDPINAPEYQNVEAIAVEEPVETPDIVKEQPNSFTAATEDITTAKQASADLDSSIADEEKIHENSTTNEPQEGRTKSDEKKLAEENEKLREMLEKLMEAGKEQISAISELHGRVNDLEKRLSRKKKMRINKHKRDLSANTMARKGTRCEM